MVRAKFTVQSKTETLQSVPTTGPDGKTVWKPGRVISVKLSPVYGQGDPNHENTKFWQASPSGTIEIGCANEAAADRFELGKEYYVDFTPADAQAA